MQIKGREGSHTLTVSRQPDFTMIYVAIVRTMIMTIGPCMSNNAELSQYFNPRNFAFRMTSTGCKKFFNFLQIIYNGKIL